MRVGDGGMEMTRRTLFPEVHGCRVSSFVPLEGGDAHDPFVGDRTDAKERSALNSFVCST